MLQTQGGLGRWNLMPTRLMRRRYDLGDIALHAPPIRKQADNPVNQSKLKEENCRANRGKMPVTVGFGHMIQRNRLRKEERR